MKPLKTIILTAVMTLASCATEPVSEVPSAFPALTGVVTDQNRNPIEHIKVTLEWSDNTDQIETYTSSEGKFRSEIIITNTDGSPVTINLTLEDIDGEDNGGLFETHTESFLLETENNSEAETPHVIDLVFRLNRATDAESSPQS